MGCDVNVAGAFDFEGGAVVVGDDSPNIGGAEAVWSTFESDGCLE